MFSIGEGDSWVSLKKRGYLFGKLCRVDRWRNWVFEALNNTKFALPQSEILERSEVRRSEASLRELCTSWKVGRLWKDVETCKVVSSAYKWIGQEVWFRRSLMNNRKRVGDRTDPWGAPQLIDLGEEQWPSTTAAIEQSERKFAERRIEAIGG